MNNKSAKLLTVSGFACLFILYSVYYFSHKRKNTRDYIYVAVDFKHHLPKFNLE